MQIPKTVIFTVGFDPKFQIKTILEESDATSYVAIISSDKHEKTIEALKDIEKLVRNYMEKQLEVWEIDFHQPENAYSSLSEKFMGLTNNRVVLDISGGMRLMIIITLSAALATLEPGLLSIKMWSEDMKGRYDLSFLTYLWLRPPLTSEDLKCLRIIVKKEGISLDDLSREMNKSKPTTNRVVNRLESLNLIEVKKKGKKHTYYPTPKGKIIAYVTMVD